MIVQPSLPSLCSQIKVGQVSTSQGLKRVI